jgi:hypothetical protein
MSPRHLLPRRRMDRVKQSDARTHAHRRDFSSPPTPPSPRPRSALRGQRGACPQSSGMVTTRSFRASPSARARDRPRTNSYLSARARISRPGRSRARRSSRRRSASGTSRTAGRHLSSLSSSTHELVTRERPATVRTLSYGILSPAFSSANAPQPLPPASSARAFKMRSVSTQPPRRR